MRNPWSATAAVALVIAGGTSGHAKPNQAASRRPPEDVNIRPPSKLAKVEVPKDAPSAPPTDKWWIEDPPCPDGASYETREEYGRHYHECRDAQGRPHGPSTTLGESGAIEGDAWYRHGKRHGLERILIPGRAAQSYMYVDDQRHGPADEYGDTGNYYRGERHGLWRLVRNGQTPQHGYFVRGQREGVWLSAVNSRGAIAVIARATYRNDRPAGEVVWWTERGDLLAIGTPHWSGLTWKLGKGKPATVTIDCLGERGEGGATWQVRKGRETVTCSYNERGELLEQTGGKRGIGCPTSGIRDLCQTDLLDPYGGASALSLDRLYQ